MEPAQVILTLLLCYAVGGLSPSWLAVKCCAGRDLRECGTGTLGATNAGRLLGRKAYALIAVLDILKGWGAMWLAWRTGSGGWWLVAAGCAVTAGHVWPAIFKFRGGKGMATAYGVILFTAPLAALLMWPVFWLGWLALRSATLASVQAFLGVPLFVMSMRGGTEGFVLAAVLALMVVWTHRSNLRTALQRRKAEAASA